MAVIGSIGCVLMCYGNTNERETERGWRGVLSVVCGTIVSCVSVCAEGLKIVCISSLIKWKQG